MGNLFKRHGRIFGYLLALLLLSLSIVLKAAGRPVTEAELGCVFALVGVGLILSSAMQSAKATNEPSSVPPSRTLMQGAVVTLFGLQWIVMPNGIGHLIGTLLLTLFMAYLVWVGPKRGG